MSKALYGSAARVRRVNLGEPVLLRLLPCGLRFSSDEDTPERAPVLVSGLQNTHRTSAVETAARIMTTISGARSRTATAATPTPISRSSTTSFPFSPSA